MATLSCPACSAPYQPGDLICLECGANLARVGRRQPSARDEGRHGGAPQPLQPPPQPPHPHQPYQGAQPQQGEPFPPGPLDQGPSPYQQPGQDAAGPGDPWRAPGGQGGGPQTPHYEPAAHRPGQQDPYAQPGGQDPYGSPGGQDPYSPPGGQDPYGQQRGPQDPYAQGRPADPYGQPGAQDPYGQQGPGAGDGYGAARPHDPYGQPGGGQDPYGQPGGGQDPYGQPGGPPDPYGQPGGGQDPYGQRGPQDPYGRQQPGAPYAPGHGVDPYGHDAYASPPRDPYGAQPGAPQPGQPLGPPPPRPQAPEVPGVRREETLVPPEEQRGQQPPYDATAFMCPHCEAVLSDPAAQQCGVCLRPIRQSTPVLRMIFATGEVKVSAGQVLVLGRDVGQSPVASTFTQYDNVSRRHSTVRLDPAGTAWIRDERSTNGTFVNGERLPPGVEAPLRDGDTVRLAADATGTVHLS